MLTSDWLFLNRNILNTHFQEITLIHKWIPKWRDISVSINFEGKFYYGRGQGTTKKMAMAKASSEVIERVMVAKNNINHITSNGFAVHPFKKDAITNAKLELIERDHFLCHVLTNTPFNETNVSTKTSRAFSNYVKKLGIEIKIATLPSEYNVSVVICALFGINALTPFGTVVGLGTNKDLNSSIDKSIMECWSSAMPILFDLPWTSITRAKIKKQTLFNPDFHRRLSLNINEGKSFKKMFNSNSKKIELNIKDSLGESFTTIQLKNWPDQFSTCPVKAVRVINPTLQNLFFDFPTKDIVNEKRLKGFLINRGLPIVKWNSELLHQLS
jgi:ribosomal protein S12 methylthiotransferase accessory factor YcaO